MRRKNLCRKSLPLGVLRLEERTVPAGDITITVGSNGSGSLDSFLFDATPGVIGSFDGGTTAGTLSTGALAAVSSSTDISVTAQGKIAFNSMGTLTLHTGSGHGVTFIAAGTAFTTGFVTVATASDTLATNGGSLNFSAGGSINICNLSTGGGGVALSSGSSGLFGASGSITARAIQAGTGSVSVQCQGSFGSISQSGTVVGGQISINASGNVVIDDVRGSTVFVQSGGSVSSAGSNPIQSTGLLLMLASSGITVNTSAASIAAFNGSFNGGAGNISITQAATPARALTTAPSGLPQGAVNGVQNTAPGGSLTITNLGEAITVAAGSPVQTAIGPITLAATDLTIGDKVNSGTARTTLTNSTAGRPFDLGNNTAGQVGLTQTELNNVTAGVLQIGSSTAGAITIDAPIAAPATWNTLTLVSAGGISEPQTASLTVPSLRLSSSATGAALSFLNGLNSVSVLAGDFMSGMSFSDFGKNLIVGVVDGDSGITSTGNHVDIRSANIDVQQPINAGTGRVDLSTPVNNVQLNLGGTDGPGTLGLTDAELGRITAGILVLSGVGATISSPISRHPGYTSLSIFFDQGGDGATITQTAPLSVANLAVTGGGPVTLTNPGNDVDTLAGRLVVLSGNPFSFRDSNALTIGNVSGTNGISTVGGPVTLTAGGAITDGNGSSVNVSGSQLTITAGGGVDLDLDVTTIQNVAAGGPITLTEASTTTLSTLNAGSGTITLDGGTFQLSTGSIVAGTLAIAGSTLNLLQSANLTIPNVQLISGTISGTTGNLSCANSFDVRGGSISANLTGAAGLTKTTNGTVTLTGACTYTGPTTVSGGTLVVGLSLSASSLVTVNGGTLGGSGSVGPLTASFGTVSPGSSPGILTANGNVSFLSPAGFVVEFTLGFAAPVGTQFVIIDNDGNDPITGNFAGHADGTSLLLAGQQFTISYAGGDGNDVTLTAIIPVSPVVTGQPANQTVVEGGSVTFTATASGVPTPTVQWQVSTNGGATFSDIPGATSTSLTFNAALSQSGNQFRAVFANTAGTATTNSATLTVVAKPTAFTLTLDVPRDTPRPLTLAGFDPAGRPLTFTVTSPPQHGTLSGTATNPTYTPAAGYIGPDGLLYKANNGFADSNIASVSINVFTPGSVQSVTVDDGAGQRSLVRSLTVTFSGVVSFAGPAANAFQLARTGGGNVLLAVDLTGSTATQTIARLTFSGPLTEGANSLIDGNYTLTVFSNQVQGGLQGGDSVTSLFRLFGDVNGDRAVDGLDLTAFRNAFGSLQGNAGYVPFLDFNGDGAIDGADLTQFRNRFGVILP
jgi:autotransporter-associated beta strand protein